MGGWIRTYTGRRFFPLDPRVEDVHILDIAHALSNQCRFTGHCRDFYSVAQHSVLVSTLHPSLKALLHDASEAYMADVATPIKHSPMMQAYRDAEARLEAVIFEAFKLSPGIPPEVKAADRTAFAIEAKFMMGAVFEGTPAAPESITELDAWTPARAEAEFLNRYFVLTEQIPPMPQLHYSTVLT